MSNFRAAVINPDRAHRRKTEPSSGTFFQTVETLKDRRSAITRSHACLARADGGVLALGDARHDVNSLSLITTAP